MSAELFQQPHFQPLEQRQPDADRDAEELDSIEEWSPSATDKNGLSAIDQQMVLVDAAREMRFAWPESLSVERVKQGVAEAALWLLLAAGVVAVGSLYFLSVIG